MRECTQALPLVADAKVAQHPTLLLVLSAGEGRDPRTGFRILPGWSLCLDSIAVSLSKNICAVGDDDAVYLLLLSLIIRKHQNLEPRKLQV